MCNLNRGMSSRAGAVSAVMMAGLMLAAIAAVALVAPTEAEMGDAQRVLYVHVSVAWLGLASFMVMATAGILYLRHRNLEWDFWAQAAAELGWLCCTLTLATGSLWAHTAWATWWTWDPRLTSSFILWLIYSGCLLVRGSMSDAHHRARTGAVLAIIGLLDVPLVIIATRWFRGIHPVSPQMEPSMRIVLVLSIISYTVFFCVLLFRRRMQLRLENLLADAMQPTQTPSSPTMVANDRWRSVEA